MQSSTPHGRRLSLPEDSPGCITSLWCLMVRRRRTIRAGILLTLLTSLLLCTVAIAEVPELLSLTDRVANDFTICRVNSLPVLGSTGHVRLGGSFAKLRRLASCALRSSRIEAAELPSFDRLALHSILRT
jgi:hypothetical protein